MDVLFTIWRSANFTLAVLGLVLLFIELRARRREHLSGRFYWQAMALLLILSAWGSLRNAIIHADTDLVRLSVTTVALVYLVISIIISNRARDANRREHEQP